MMMFLCQTISSFVPSFAASTKKFETWSETELLFCQKKVFLHYPTVVAVSRTPGRVHAVSRNPWWLVVLSYKRVSHIFLTVNAKVAENELHVMQVAIEATKDQGSV